MIKFSIIIISYIQLLYSINYKPTSKIIKILPDSIENIKISPNRKYIAYTNNGNLYITNIKKNSDKPNKISDNVIYLDFLWSIDGVRLIYLKNKKTHTNISYLKIYNMYNKKEKTVAMNLT